MGKNPKRHAIKWHAWRKNGDRQIYEKLSTIYDIILFSLWAFEPLFAQTISFP